MITVTTTESSNTNWFFFFSIIVPSSGALVVSHNHPIHVLASWCVILFVRYDDKRPAALIILVMCSWSKRVELGKSRCCFEFCSCAIWLQLLLLWKAFICGRPTLHCSQPSSDWQNIHFFQLHSTGLQSLFGPNFVSFQISCNIKCAQQWKERKQWKSKRWKKSFWERVDLRDLVQRLDFLGGKAPPVIEQLKRGKSISKRWGNSCLSFFVFDLGGTKKNQERFLAFFEAYDVGEPPETFSCAHCTQVTSICCDHPPNAKAWERPWRKGKWNRF